MKKVLSILLSALMLISVFTAVPLTAGAAAPDALPKLTEEIAKAGIAEENLNTYYFYMSDSWKNEYNDGYDASLPADQQKYYVGLYWWGGTLNYEGQWPGVSVQETLPEDDNIYVAKIPNDVDTIIWNNTVDGGMDNTLPIYCSAFQTENANTDWYYPNEDGYGFYPQGTENVGSFKNMILVPNVAGIKENPWYSGANPPVPCVWFYYYGNGEYGYYPTRAEAIANNAVYSGGEFPAYAGSTDKDFEYEILDDGTAEITYFDGYGSTLEIPGELDGHTVTSIGESAFEFCDYLAEITIPDSVTSIGDSAFAYCSSLSSITIPDSVASIGSYAFESCTSLKNATIGDGVASIGSWAFYCCESLTSVTIPDSVTSISESVFYSCESLESVEIGNRVTSIGDLAFSCCERLASVTIPDSVTSIGNGAFTGCTSLADIEISQSVSYIGEAAFSDCTSLTSVKIPNGVTSIESSTFSGCANLSEIIIPDSVTSIKYAAFYDCTNLLEVTIPSTVSNIDSLCGLGYIYHKSGDDPIDGFTIYGYTGSEAEAYATENGFVFISLGEMPDSPDNPSVGINDFEYIVLDDGTAEITEYTGSATELEIPSELDGYVVASVGESAFDFCISLERVVLPLTLKFIGYMSFWGCENLKEINIPSKVEYIGDGAFGITNIKNFYIPASVTYCDEPFDFNVLNEVMVDENNPNYYSKDGLLFRKSDNELLLYPRANERTEYSIPEGTSKINSMAFLRGAGNLKELTIPGSVKVIESGCFCYCNFNNLVLCEGVKTIERNAFISCGFANIYIPKSVIEIGDYAVGYTGQMDHEYNKVADFTIHGYPGTAAETYANDNGFEFVNLGEAPTTEPPTDVTQPDSSDSTEPGTSEPTEPGTQSNPTDNTESTEPSESTTTTDPDSTQPTNPTVTDPTEGTKATQPATAKPKTTVKKAKKANPMTVQTKTKTVKAKKLKKAKQTVKAITVSKAKGKVSYAKIKSGTTKKIFKKVTIGKNGKLTLKKGKYKKGTYKIKVKITAKGNSAYKSKSKTVTVRIKVK